MNLKSWLVKAAYMLSENRAIKAIRNGLISMMPLMLIGSFAVLVINLPLAPFQAFMFNMLGDRWKDIPLAIFNGTTQVMSIGILISISYSLAIDTDLARMGQINPMIVSLISFGCLITITNMVDNSLQVVQIGAMGLFVAIMVAVLSHFLFFYFYRHKLFRVKLFTDAADSLLTQSLAALEPAVWTFIIFGFIKFIPSMFGINDLHAFVYELLKGLFRGMESSLLSAIVFNLATHIFWFFGLHGNNILENVSQELWVPKLTSNLDVIAAGGIPTEIFAKQFFDVFVFIGGAGATLCLIAALLIASRKTNTSKLTKLSIPMGLFNINETIIYGLPIVLNPFYLIPFLLVPCALTVTTYLAMYFKLVPVIQSDIIWTTPIVIGGYVATGSFRGVLLQLLNFILGTAIYIPFVKMNERFKADVNKKVLDNLNTQINYVETNKVPIMLIRMDDIGSLARVLATDIENDLMDNTGFYLEYQPQINNDGRMIGCEALLRWNHYKFGRIPPPTVITIADEAEIGNKLNEWIYEEAFAQQRKLYDLGYRDIIMSINLSPNQLSNKNLIGNVKSLLKKYQLDPKFIEIEITENIALDQSKEANKMLDDLKATGIKLAIDDFGMGHTSLLYIRSFEVNTIKLDGSLTQDVLIDPNCSDIITAIVSLCKGLGMSIVSEVVETEEQRDKLKELGCEVYQGYLYSRPLVAEKLVEYLEKVNR